MSAMAITLACTDICWRVNRADNHCRPYARDARRHTPARFSDASAMGAIPASYGHLDVVVDDLPFFLVRCRSGW